MLRCSELLGRSYYTMIVAVSKVPATGRVSRRDKYSGKSCLFCWLRLRLQVSCWLILIPR